MKLEGKRVLLSGATGGIGRAIAEQLAAEGAKVVLSSRKKAELTELAKSLPGGARRHKVIVADLSKDGAAAKLVRDAGNVDVLVANAAVPGSGKLTEYSPDELTRALRVNLESPMLMARELAPKLIKKGEGQIVLIGSLAGRVASPRASIYNATKFGLRGFALGLREDLHPHGVGVSLVAPGFVAEAGMFADSGSTETGGLGTTTPKKVAKGVVRAIKRNRHEINVAPRRLRVATRLGHSYPSFAARLQRRVGAEQMADELAAGQADKR